MLVSACGSESGSKTPTSPSSPAATTGGTSAPGAVVNGIVMGATSTQASSASDGARPMDASGVLRVDVVGTSLSSAVDGQGHFSLTGVPAGSAQLKFAGPAVSATITVNVESNQNISVIVSVTGSNAAVVSDSRNPDAGQLPINGSVEGLTGTAAAFQFTVNGYTIHGDALTAFYGDGSASDSFVDLKNGMRVEVKATARDGGLYAFRLHLNKDNATTTPAPSPEPPPGQEEESASIEGTLTSLGGAVPNLQLVVAGVTVRTSASTDVQRRGDKQDLGTLRVGQTLHVIGTRRSDRSIDARQIQIKDDAASGEFEIEGSIGGLKGSCPSLTFKVNGYSIAANASTTFTGAACAVLKNGDKVTVNGIKQADGTVLATLVRSN
jgi:hypothetical protein